MKRLGVDPGQRRVGLALAEPDVRVAVPLRTVAGGSQAARQVAEVARELEVDEIVVGLPLRLDGTEGAAARRARAFGTALEREAGRPVVLWDERLTTAAAERSLSAIGVRGRARRRVVDQSAAALLLQSYLDAREGTRDGDPWPEGRRPAENGADAAHDDRGDSHGR